MVSSKTLARSERTAPQLLAGRGPRRRPTWLAALVGAALGSSSAVASAHAPPLGARVVSSPSGASEVIVTNRGLLFREPATGATRLLCNEALRITTSEIPSAALLGDGTLLVASSSGLRSSRDEGCTWNDVGGMEATNTPALASDPNDPDTVYVARYDGEMAGLLVTHDGGRTWSRAFATAEGDFVHSLLVSRADPGTLYATLTTFAPEQRPVHSLLRTRDGGQSWQRLPLPLDERDYAAMLASTDPDDPTRLVVYTVANSPGLDDARLLQSSDAGDSFEAVLTRPEIRDADFDSEGRLWVATRDGLYRGASGAGFERVSAASELGCVMAQGDIVLVCGHYAGADTPRSGVGLSTDAGQVFEPLLDFANVESPVQCEPESLTAALCAGPWRDWQDEMFASGAPAMSSPYGGPAAAGPAAAPATEGAGALEVMDDPDPVGNSCALAPEPPSRLTSCHLAVTAAALAGWLRRSGRRRSVRPPRADVERG